MCRTESGEWLSAPHCVSLLLVSCCAILVLGCTDKGSFQTMAQQPRYEALENSDYDADQSSARAPQAGAVARGELRDDTLLFTGLVNGQVANTFPFAITSYVLLSGQQRFNIFCAPCHDMTGGGNGPIVRAGFPHAPTFHSARLRNSPLGHFFLVITNGQGQMPSYGSQVAVRDRWAIIAYIRALQLSQNARIEDVPSEERNRLGEPPK